MPDNPQQSEPERPGSPRRRELLERTVDYVSRHGSADLSLRPLAAEIGTSAGVLMYLFGSKETLLAEAFALAREQQLDLVISAMEAGGTPADAILRLWSSWLADPGRAGLMRLFFDNYVRSLHGVPAYEDFAVWSVNQWLERLRPLTSAAPDPDAAATLLLAVLRGLLLDVLASGKQDRADRALSAYLEGF